uniref:Uncharacterized protein n=1 Tax=Cacopsylla melanoneura TaxID=428564 RepID=A0A8D8TZQ6_9HEMI
MRTESILRDDPSTILACSEYLCCPEQNKAQALIHLRDDPSSILACSVLRVCCTEQNKEQALIHLKEDFSDKKKEQFWHHIRTKSIIQYPNQIAHSKKKTYNSLQSLQIGISA